MAFADRLIALTDVMMIWYSVKNRTDACAYKADEQQMPAAASTDLLVLAIPYQKAK